jgi:hypothetical protein
MTGTNVEPFSTRPSLTAGEVFPLKNVVQVFLIAVIEAAEPVPVDLADGAADGEAGAVVGAMLGDAEDAAADAEACVLVLAAGVVLLELLDEQAVSAAATARPSTGPTRSRRSV